MRINGLERNQNLRWTYLLLEAIGGFDGAGGWLIGLLNYLLQMALRWKGREEGQRGH